MKSQRIKGMRCFTSHQRRQMRQFLINKYGPYCQICKEKGLNRKIQRIHLEVERTKFSFSFDHIIALADGGENHIDNMQPTHIRCNELKGSISYGSSKEPGISNSPKLIYSSVSSGF